MSFDVDGEWDQPKLPLWNTICLTYATYFRDFLDVLATSWLWLILAAVPMGIASWLQFSWFAEVVANAKPGTSSPAQHISNPTVTVWLPNIANLIVLIAGVSIAVAWHRHIILGERPGLSVSNLATKNLWRYIGVGVAICLIVAVPALIVIVPIFRWLFSASINGQAHQPFPMFSIIAPIVLLLLYVGGTAVVMRLCLVLPARAVGDSQLTFKAAWKRTRGNIWRLLWGIVACTLPPIVVLEIAVWALIGFPRPEMFSSQAFADRMTIMSMIFVIYYLLITPIGIGFMSYAYQHFFEQT
jgi:hypothetical protein